MKKSILFFLFIALFWCETRAEGPTSSFGYREASHPAGALMGNLFGAGNINGLLPGAIYLSFSAGPSTLMGNIIGRSSGAFSLGKSNMASIGISRVFRGRVGYELSFMYGKYDYSDVSQQNDHPFDSTIGEVSLTGQWFLLGGSYSTHNFQTLYLLGGIGMIYSHFDSERKEPACFHMIFKNSTISPSIPFGVGYMLGGRIVQMGVEVTEHFAFSDYLDKVSPDSKGNLANDFLAHFALKVRVRLYQCNHYE